MNNLNQNIAPDLLIAYLTNQISNENATIVQTWIDSSPENKKYFEQCKTIWEETGKLVPTPISVNVDEAWNAMSRRIDMFENHKYEAKQVSFTKMFTRTFMIRAAAAIFIPIIAISTFYILQTKTQEQIAITTTKTIQDTLSDGSIIALNKNSKLTYPDTFSGNTREVTMEGEAFFKIAPNKEKPFIIHAENTLIRVVGTKFNVKSYADNPEIEVLVESGKVLFLVINNTNDSTSVSLEAGDKGIYNKQTKKLQKIKAHNQNELFWNNKTLVFDKTNLSDVIQTIEKNYGISIDLKQNSLQKLRFSSTFVNQPLDSILFILETTLDLRHTKEGTHYILHQNEQE